MAYKIAEEKGAEGIELIGWTLVGVIGGGIAGAVVGGALGAAVGYGVGLIGGSAPAVGSNGSVALWSGGSLTKQAAVGFAKQTGAKLISSTFAGKTLSFVSHFLPKKISNYLWGKLSVEFVSGASFATIFLLESGVKPDSIFFKYEIFVLLSKGIERIMNFLG